MTPSSTPAPDFIDSAPAPAPASDRHREAFELEPVWQGQPLQAFTLARQSLAAMLNSTLPALGPEPGMEAHMPRVWSVLWLCLHEPHEWRHLRSNPALWWETIEAWAETHCSRPLWPEAVTVVYGRHRLPEEPEDDQPEVMGLWEAARANVITIKSQPGQKPGNAPGQ